MLNLIMLTATLFLSAVPLAAQDMKQGNGIELSPGIQAQVILQPPPENEIAGAHRIDVIENGITSTVYTKTIHNLGGLGKPPQGVIYSGLAKDNNGLIAYTTYSSETILFIEITREGQKWVMANATEKPKSTNGISVKSVQILSPTTATMIMSDDTTSFFFSSLYSEENYNDVADADIRALYHKAQQLFASKELSSIEKGRDIALGVRSGKLLAEGILKVNVLKRPVLMMSAKALPKEELQKLVIALIANEFYWDAVGGSEGPTAKHTADIILFEIIEGMIGRKVNDDDFVRSVPTEALKKEIEKMSLSWVVSGEILKSRPEKQ